MHRPIALQDQHVTSMPSRLRRPCLRQPPVERSTDWIHKVLVERRNRMNSAVAKKFLVRTHVKNEVKRRIRTGGR